MNASVVDLRYKMKSVLEALDRHEEVTVLHRGQVKGIIKPVLKPSIKVQDHPFFGSSPASEEVESVIERLRGLRTDAV